MTDIKYCRYCKVQPVEKYEALLIDEGVYCADCAEELEEREHEACLYDGSWDHD